MTTRFGNAPGIPRSIGPLSPVRGRTARRRHAQAEFARLSSTHPGSGRRAERDRASGASRLARRTRAFRSIPSRDRGDLPVVAENSVEITKRFYPHMFAAHPELMRGVQRREPGDREQPQALAASVVAFAVNLIEVPDAPDARSPGSPTSTCRWGSSRRSTRSSATTSCGPSATSSATPSPPRSRPPGTRSTGCWPAADRPGGRPLRARGDRPGDAWRKWRVVGEGREPDEIVSFRLAPVDDRRRTTGPASTYAISVPMPDGVRQPRQYSLLRAATASAAR